MQLKSVLWIKHNYTLGQGAPICCLRNSQDKTFTGYREALILHLKYFIVVLTYNILNVGIKLHLLIKLCLLKISCDKNLILATAVYVLTNQNYRLTTKKIGTFLYRRT